MNLQVKAAAIVAGYVSVSVLAIIGAQLAFTYIPINVLAMIGAIVVGGYILSLLYTVVLERLKIDAQIKEMSKKP